MKSSPKGVRVVRKRLADGTVKEYTYERKSVSRRAAYQPDSMDALLAAFRNSPEFSAKAPNTKAQYAIYLRPFDKIGAVSVKLVTRKMILGMRDGIAGARGNGAATAFGRIAGVLFAWALDRGWLDFSPATRIKALSGGHLRAWSETDLAHALMVLPSAYSRVALLGAFTGQRRGDLIALRWSAYDGVTLRLRQEKTKAEMVIPVHRDLKPHLDVWKKTTKTLTILAAPRGQPWTGEHLSRERARELREAGLPGLGVHGLRKLAAARLAEAGCSAHEIASITGHRTLAMVELYTRSADQQKLARSAMDRLERQPSVNRKPEPGNTMKIKDK